MGKKRAARKRRELRKPNRAAVEATAISVTISEKLANALDELAENNGWSRSEAVTRAVRLLIETNGG